VESVRLRCVRVAAGEKGGKRAAVRRGAVDAAAPVAAYVVFADSASAVAALAANGSDVGGRTLRVDAAAPSRARPATRDGAPAPAPAGVAAAALARGRTVFVGNLPPDVDDEAVAVAFGGPVRSGGPVTAVRCVRDPATGLGKGFAFVELADEAGLASALARRGGAGPGGRPLRVSRAGAPRAGGAPPARGGGRGGGRGGRGSGRGGGRGAPGRPADWAGVRTKGVGKVARSAGAAPRSGRGGSAGPARGSSTPQPAKAAAAGKRPAVAARKAAAQK